MTNRIITKKQSETFEDNWKAVKRPVILNMLRKVNPRVWKVITENEFPPITEEFDSTYLHGKVGTGKSVSAAWRMLEWSRLKAINGKSKQNALFIPLTTLLHELKNSYSNTSEVTEREIIFKYSNIDILVLDDFGVVKTTDWVYQILYMILDYRYSHFKPTIITANISLDELSTQLGDERISSRVAHDCGDNVIEFIGKPKR